MRPMTLPLLAALLALALVLPVFAQETADVCVGGGLVARLRDRGAFATVAERVANVDQKIVEVVSSKDTQHPQVTVKQKGSLWTVYAWDIPVVAVYPAEAKTNKMTEKQLAQLWAKNLTQQLPKATPCSKLPPSQLGYGAKPGTTVTASTKPGTAAVAKPAAAKPPAGAAKPAITNPAAKPPTTVVVKPATTTPKPAAVKPKPAAAKPVAFVGNENGAELLIVDAMRTVREMNAEDWTARKESAARELYSNLLYYLTGQGTPPRVGAATAPVTATTKPATVTKPAVTKPATKPAAATTKPPTTKPATTAAKPATKPATTTATTKPATTPKPAATAAATPTTDPSMAKVPQKNRWRAKFAAAKPAYDKLAASDPEAAKPINAMLAASRQAFAYGKFDEAEQQVDAALAALGVTFKE
ncbi:hypothetical protein LLH23_18630 [bacterium]|nr:hypothetical protein [bacterium]